jgi:hypothetical protein
MSLKLVLLAAAVASAPTLARAGEAACWFERGVVVVTAQVAGVTGDFILDTGAPQTILAETQARGAGYEAPEIAGEVDLAGVRTAALPIAVKDIDVRTGLFATPIAGIIGADVLKPYVLDLSARPCRLALNLPSSAPGFRAVQGLPLAWIAGEPTTRASVSDGHQTRTGAFALATGADTAVRLADSLAAAPGAAKPQELYPYGVLRPSLRALSFAGQIAEAVPAGLIKAPDPGIAGEIGAPLLMAFRLRFDFPAKRLQLAPNEKGPGVRRGP